MSQTLYSQQHERVINWGMGEDRWNKETQFPQTKKGTAYMSSEELARLNVQAFHQGTEKALYSKPVYRVADVEGEETVSLSAAKKKKKRVYERTAPKHDPVDFSGLLHAKGGSPKSWHNATAFKAVKENIGDRIKASDKAKKDGAKAPKAFKFSRVSASSAISTSRPEDKSDDLFNGAFQRAVTAIEKAGYKADKQDVRNYKLAGWKETSYQDLKKRIEGDKEDGDTFKVAKFKKDVVVMLRGAHLDIPVAWINEDGTLYQNTVKGSAWVQREAMKKLDPVENDSNEPAKSESGQATNDASHHGMYISRLLKDPKGLQEYLQRNGLQELQDDPHVTLAYSRTPFAVARAGDQEVTCPGGTLGILGADDGPKHVVLMLDQGNEHLTDRWNYFRKQGAGWDFPDYNPHVTIGKIPEGQPVPDLSRYPRFDGDLVFGPETIVPLDESK